ncbi:MAG: hypothetical protein R2856_14990 [Caldilineaceae bacterium]|nr:hypothetical protein [Caldilineaceae bacterium]
MSKRGKIAIGGMDDPAPTTSASATRATDDARAPSAPPPPPRARTESTAPEPTSPEPTPSERKTQRGRDYDPSPRRPRDERKNAFDLSAWLIEGVLGIAEEVRHNDLGLSEEFWIHAYAARKEALLAARALIDTAIERCDADDEKDARREAGRRRRGRVDINFD